MTTAAKEIAMNRILDGVSINAHSRTETALNSLTSHDTMLAALSHWYRAHSIVRRVWVIEESDALRVVVNLEPTLDGDDPQPLWLANTAAWSEELQSRMRRAVRLELLGTLAPPEPMSDRSDSIVAEISWRDDYCN
jgi:hypothetical protein